MAILATAQQIIDRAHAELGLPSSTVGSSLQGQTTGQMLNLINALGDDCVKIHDWQFLQFQQEYTGDGVQSEFDLPADYGRVVNQTVWAANDKRMLYGPLNAQQWGWTQYGIVSTGIYYRYRILHNKFVVFPTPPNGAKFAFTYISKNWVIDGLVPTTFKDTVEIGEDTPMFDRGLMIAAAKKRLWDIKGFDTTTLSAEFRHLLEAETGQNQGAPTLYLGKPAGYHLIDVSNVPDGSWEV